MKIDKLAVGFLETNCYILYDESSLEAAVVDPGAEGERIAKLLEEKGLKLKYILITHGHYDHIKGVRQLKQKLNGQVLIHEDEAIYLLDTNKNLSARLFDDPQTVDCDKLLKTGDEIKVGNITLQVIKVPGHTEASACYFDKHNHVLFSGDTLFKGTVGRTDFYNGSPTDLVKNIQEHLLILPDDTVVYPGHGWQTTIGEEKKNNPCLMSQNSFWEL